SGTNCSARQRSTSTTSGAASSRARRTATRALADLQYATLSGARVGSAAAHWAIPRSRLCRTCLTLSHEAFNASICFGLGATSDTHTREISCFLASRGIRLCERTFTAHGTNGTMYRIFIENRGPLKFTEQDTSP